MFLFGYPKLCMAAYLVFVPTIASVLVFLALIEFLNRPVLLNILLPSGKFTKLLSVGYPCSGTLLTEPSGVCINSPSST